MVGLGPAELAYGLCASRAWCPRRLGQKSHSHPRRFRASQALPSLVGILNQLVVTVRSADERTWCCERCREAALGRRHSIANLQTEAAARSRVLAPKAGSGKPMSRLVPLASMPAGLLSAFAHLATRL